MINKICNLARNAGAAIMSIYYSNELVDISYKLDKSPVTSADKIADKVIKDGLYTIAPNIAILSEESVKNIQYVKNLSTYWLIDPLDGTKEFLKKNGEFTVNISLIEHGIPILGVIYAPYFNILYFAFKKQAWKISPSGYKKKISVVQSNIPRFIVSRSHPNKKLYDFINKTENKKYTIKKLGSSLKFCYIAEGKAQYYPRFGTTYIWDTAAGHAIVTAAGGSVLTYHEKMNLNYCLLSRKSLKNPDFIVSS
ncbi:3'(2'),5'-bisphosphate nucleotidase [Buchnera aphidicola (Aphis nasturtii)]|uniref:3'(2'),5'-bisphosphate nucleotidase CysQ n=1 Tax=Buchnera aphidicola TaxID=9 RepID=UPI0010C57765|nr:3'(2'),5'-bisphosphate nucleotidase CysQ [Buchnera aphidicola]QCI18509.1 3'(2'),5'-bisphosphate nucleotidase [Buchnera aphidicola (Aphis nasturtii)]